MESTLSLKVMRVGAQDEFEMLLKKGNVVALNKKMKESLFNLGVYNIQFHPKSRI
mgnify:CR=1 FL=1